jgi:hypothetical protein
MRLNMPYNMRLNTAYTLYTIHSYTHTLILHAPCIIHSYAIHSYSIHSYSIHSYIIHSAPCTMHHTLRTIHHTPYRSTTSRS